MIARRSALGPKGAGMAVAVVQDWVDEETDRSTTNYDAIAERLRARGTPPSGMLVHTAGFTGHGFRIFEVWESREDFERFTQEVLMPIVGEIAGSDSPMPDLTVYELHDFQAAPQ
jgi:hypothetical protein